MPPEDGRENIRLAGSAHCGRMSGIAVISHRAPRAQGPMAKTRREATPPRAMSRASRLKSSGFVALKWQSDPPIRISTLPAMPGPSRRARTPGQIHMPDASRDWRQCARIPPDQARFNQPMPEAAAA